MKKDIFMILYVLLVGWVLIGGATLWAYSEAEKAEIKPCRSETEAKEEVVKKVEVEIKDYPAKITIEIDDEEPAKPKWKIYENVPLEEKYQIKAQVACEQYNVPFAFWLALVESESAFQIDAIGDSGRSIGLMQINKPNWDRYGLDAELPFDNIEIGVRMIHELTEKYGEMDAIVMAYKGGEAKADEWIKEGYKLPVCDVVSDATVWWQENLKEKP